MDSSINAPILRVLHVIPSVSLRHGGPSVALPLMARSLYMQGVSVDVVTTDDDGPNEHLAKTIGVWHQMDGWRIIYHRKQTEFYKVSFGLKSWIESHAADYDIIHIHALFSFTSVVAAKAAKRAHVPYIIRPLGVLNQWGMKNRRRWLKSLSFRILEAPILRDAATIHYTSEAERNEAEAAGTRINGSVIPIGIDVPPNKTVSNPTLFHERFPETKGKKLVLFLSRLDPKKGLELLLQSFHQVASSEPLAWLAIAGGGDEAYVRSLHELAAKLGVDGRITWAGRIDGELKLGAFAAARFYVLTSYSENFGIAAVEALAAGLPTVLSEGVAVSADIAAANAGLSIPHNVEATAQALALLLGSDQLVGDMGEAAWQLARNRFSLDAMGQALINLYSNIKCAR